MTSREQEIAKLKDIILDWQFVSSPVDTQPPFFWKWADDELEQLALYILEYTQKIEAEAQDRFYNHYSGEPEKHDVPCNDCGSDYWMDYLLPHPVFNAVCPQGGYLCLPCFAKRLEAQFVNSKQSEDKS